VSLRLVIGVLSRRYAYVWSGLSYSWNTCRNSE